MANLISYIKLIYAYIKLICARVIKNITLRSAGGECNKVPVSSVAQVRSASY